MRGRALETVITPFSFREFARDRGTGWEPARLPGAAETSAWLACFDDYVRTGGFPEAGRMDSERELVALLQGYVDSVLFRDVVERHGIANVVALRAFVRQLLRQAATLFSVSKVHADFRSRGIGMSKETLLALLTHLEDAFLVFTLPVASRSERRRQGNPRKLYLADHGLAQAFSPASGLDRGRLVENLVACELARQSRDLAYVKPADGHEVDFLATAYDGAQRLVRVASDVSEAAIFGRELRALAGAAEEFPRFAKIGIPAPEFFGPFVGAFEIVCGALILLGLVTRFAAVPLLVIMAVALFTVKVPILLGHEFMGFALRPLDRYGFLSMIHEARNDLAMTFGSLFLLIVGVGPWSLDFRLARSGKPPSPSS